jgi:hypothetical protein
MSEEVGETFEEDLKVITEWESGGEKFRLINLGAGPDQLQVMNIGADEWKRERGHYEWGVLTHHIKKLSDELKKKNDMILRAYVMDARINGKKYNPFLQDIVDEFPELINEDDFMDAKRHTKIAINEGYEKILKDLDNEDTGQT